MSYVRLLIILIWRPIYRQPVYVGIYLPLAPAHSNYRLETKKHNYTPEGGGGVYCFISVRPSFCPSKIFFSVTIDGRNLIFGHKCHIGIPYCGKRFWTHQIPTSCLPTWFLYTLNIYAHFSSHFSQQLLITEIWYLVTSFIYVCHIVGSVFGPVRFVLPVCRLSWFLYTLNIYAYFSSYFFSATIDGWDLIFGHKLHIGTPYHGKRFWTH
jgi:hypothetical protein